MKSLEGPDLFDPVVTSIHVRKGVCRVLRKEGRGEQTDCGWAKGLTVFFGAVGIMEQENKCVLQWDLSCSLLLMHMHSLLSMAPLYEFCRKKEKSVIL